MGRKRAEPRALGRGGKEGNRRALGCRENDQSVFLSDLRSKFSDTQSFNSSMVAFVPSAVYAATIEATAPPICKTVLISKFIFDPRYAGITGTPADFAICAAPMITKIVPKTTAKISYLYPARVAQMLLEPPPVPAPLGEPGLFEIVPPGFAVVLAFDAPRDVPMVLSTPVGFPMIEAPIDDRSVRMFQGLVLDPDEAPPPRLPRSISLEFAVGKPKVVPVPGRPTPPMFMSFASVDGDHIPAPVVPATPIGMMSVIEGIYDPWESLVFWPLATVAVEFVLFTWTVPPNTALPTAFHNPGCFSLPVATVGAGVVGALVW